MPWEHVNSTLKSPWWVILAMALGPQDLDAADTKNHQQAYTVWKTGWTQQRGPVAAKRAIENGKSTVNSQM